MSWQRVERDGVVRWRWIEDRTPEQQTYDLFARARDELKRMLDDPDAPRYSMDVPPAGTNWTYTSIWHADMACRSYAHQLHAIQMG